MKFNSGQFPQGLCPNPQDVFGVTFRSIDPKQRLVVAMGFGIQDGPLPIRAIAYIIPVMRLLDQLPQSTRVEFYIAVEGVIRANGSHMEPARLRQNAALLADLIRKYVAVTYPQHAGKVRVLMDKNIHEDKVVDSALRCMMDAANRVYESDPTIRNFFQKRGGPSALRYGTEHLLYMRDPVRLPMPAPVIVDGMDFDFDNIVMVGGPAERVFHRLRMALLQEIGIHQHWKSHQLFTHLGSPPCYHFQAGEPAWSELRATPDEALTMLRQTGQAVVKDMDEHLSVMWDLMVLLADAGGMSDFRSLDAKQVRKGNDPDAKIVAALQRGWQVVRDL